MYITKDDVLTFISGLSVLELAELVKEFEEKFGVKAQPVSVNCESDEINGFKAKLVSVNCEDFGCLGDTFISKIGFTKIVDSVNNVSYVANANEDMKNISSA